MAFGTIASDSSKTGKCAKSTETTAAKLRAAALESLRTKAISNQNSSDSKDADSSDGSSGTHQAKPAHLSMLDEPGRYADDIQGELVPRGDNSVTLPGLSLPRSSTLQCSNSSAIKATPRHSSITDDDEDFESLLARYRNPPEASSPEGYRAERNTYYDHDAGKTLYNVDYSRKPIKRNGRNSDGMFEGGSSDGVHEQSRGGWGLHPPLYQPSTAPAVHGFGQTVYAPVDLLSMHGFALGTGYPPPLDTSSRQARSVEQFVHPQLSTPPHPALPDLYPEAYIHERHEPAVDHPLFPPSKDHSRSDSQLSEGELDATASHAYSYLSDGEVQEQSATSTSANDAESADTADIAVPLAGQMDVVGIAKSRIEEILKMKNPQLLKKPPFRALMLLLQCIKLDDPEVIYDKVGSAPILVVYELSSLSHEFGLSMVTDACMTRLLTADASQPQPELAASGPAEPAETGALESHPPPPPSPPPPLPPSRPRSPQLSTTHTTALAGTSSQGTDSESVDMNVHETSDDSPSSPDVDMDTGSDSEYECPVGSSGMDTASLPTPQPSRSEQLVGLSSRDSTPQPPARFSRSRAPSPPSALPRTPRTPRSTYGSPVPFAHPGMLFTDSRQLPPSAYGARQSQSPSPAQTEQKDSGVDSTTFIHDNDRLIVTVDSSDSEEDYDGDAEGASAPTVTSRQWPSGSTLRRRTPREESRMLVDECRRLLSEEGAGISRSNSRPDLARINTRAHSDTRSPTQSASSDAKEKLLKAQVHLKAQEKAIAQLKLKISRKQTEVLLRKKLHESKLERSGGLAASTSAPGSPYERTGQATALKNSKTGDAKAQDKEPAGVSAPTRDAISASSTDMASSRQCGSEPWSPNVCDSIYELQLQQSDASGSAASSDSSPLQRTDLSRGKSADASKHRRPNVDARETSLSSSSEVAITPELPDKDQFSNIMAEMPKERRAEILARTMTTLKSAISSKRAELDYIMHAGGAMTSAAVENLKRSVALASSGAADKRRQLQVERQNVQRQIAILQSRLSLIDMESDILAHDYAAALGYQATLDRPLASPSSNDHSNFRADALHKDISAMQQFIESICKALGMPRPAEATHALSTRPLSESNQQSSEASRKPAERAVSDRSDKQGSKKDLASLRSKLLAMKKDQDAMAQKLSTLARKRKQMSPGEDGMSAAKRAKDTDEPPALPAPDAPQKPLSTPYSTLDKAIHSALQQHAEHARLWRESLVGSIDHSILRPLVVVDGMGCSDVVDIPDRILSAMLPSKGPAAGARPYRSVTSRLLAPRPRPRPTYIPYDSPIGRASSVIPAASSPLEASSESEPFPAGDYSLVTTKDILEMLKVRPDAGFDTVQQYYAAIQEDLRLLDAAGAGSACNADIARSLMPIWRRHRHLLAKDTTRPANPLRQALFQEKPREIMAGVSILTSGNHSTGRRPIDTRALKRVTDKASQFQPLLNRDLIQLVSSPGHSREPKSEASHRANRYFDRRLSDDDSDADSVGNDNDSDDGIDSSEGMDTGGSDSLSDVEPRTSDPSPALQPNEPAKPAEDLCRRALSILKRRSPMERPNCSMYDAVVYLNAPGGKQIGKAIKFLADSLLAHPESEQLWDLYLELYLRQNVSADDAVSAFTDATKFHPESPGIWRRYVHWCGWNLKSASGAATDRIAWHSRLAMVVTMAIKYLAGDGLTVLSEETSAVVAETIVYFWECMWSAFALSQPKQAAEDSSVRLLALARRQLTSCMLSCLTSKTMRALRTEIANARASGDQAGLAGTAAANSTAEWVLAKVLLPHHLLFVVQTAAHCSLEGSFVPRAVLRSMYAALYSGPRSQSTYFICLEAFAKRHALDPSDVPRISGLFEHIQKALANHHRIDARAGDQVQPTVYHKSRCMCLAAVRATLAQLKEHMLVCMGSQGDDCESLAYRIARRPTEEACIPHLLEGISAAGVENCILVAALCCTSHGSRAPWDRATRILRVYAKFLDATMKSSADRSMPFALPTGINGSDTISANELRQWAQEARSVFYEAVGYSGAASPMSPKDLSLRLVAASSDEALADTGANPKQLWRTRSGFWANIALLELLHGYYENNRESVGSGALDSAVAWLRCAFNYLGRDDAGSRAQIWMLLLRLRMAQAPLTHGDLAQMHADLAPDSDLLRLHASTPCFALVNHVLGTILRLAATTETLKAVRSYIASVAPTNTELTVRLIARASSMEGSRVDAAGVLKRAQYRNPSDPLLAEIANTAVAHQS